jgi:Zn-finger in ubiquitin-hydrolases and other protein
MDPIGSINPAVPPSGTGCLECEETNSWWLHLRRCAECGHIGCCDNSLNRHARAHFQSSGHPVIQSFEPGEDWFFDWRTGAQVEGQQLAAPTSHPLDQPVPGPAGRVPRDWQEQLIKAESH